MEMERIQVTIAAEMDQVRILATRANKDVLKAVLGPARLCHPRAAATLLEGLALWHQHPLSVVLCVDERNSTYASALYENLGVGAGLGLELDIGERRLHYEVGIALQERRGRRRGRLCGLGDFRDLRQLSFPEALR